MTVNNVKKSFLSFLLALIVLCAFFGLFACTDGDEGTENEGAEYMETKVVFTIGETDVTASLADTSAAKALVEKLKTGPITIDMRDYGGWEKVGEFGFDLPATDSRITAQPCEFVLYQGNQLVIFYGSNTWSYTRLGRFDGITQSRLIELLGSGNITVTISPIEK